MNGRVFNAVELGGITPVAANARGLRGLETIAQSPIHLRIVLPVVKKCDDVKIDFCHVLGASAPGLAAR
jgi:hypothetical protein